MKKVVSLMAVLTFACMLFAQVNINSTTNVQNGNNYSDGLLVTNQYTGTQLDRYGIKATSLQQADWGIGGDFEGGFRGCCGNATMIGVGDRYGVMGTATTGATYGSGNTVYGGLFWAYNSKATKIGVKGGVWNDDGTVPANQYGVLGQALGTPASGILSYGVYCMGNGASTGTWTWASDEKLKTNIAPMGSVIEKIKKLNALSYNYDVAKYPKMGLDPNKKFGFTAQNVEAVFPELVRNDVCPTQSVSKDGK